MPSDNTTLNTDRRGAAIARSRAPVLVLAVVWSKAEPKRVGELLVPDGEELVFGRGDGEGAARLTRQRPGANLDTGTLDSPGVSRAQWRIRAQRDAMTIENIGRRALLHNGVQADRATVRAGDLVEIAGQLLMLAVARPPELPPQRLPDALVPPFGEADAFGIVGESALVWELRRQLAFAAGRDDHVLLTGGSGSGKELAAHAIHRLSRRASATLVARNAATLPDGLIDAELFGNPRDYPNPGMPERPGLIGAASGSTLFLDEIGELSHTLQAHLLRVLDHGEYHRLGESRPRDADVRIVAATNRDPAEIKHDLLARLRMRVRLPPLERRREDIPLIARHLLRTLAERDALVAERAFADGVIGEPSWSADLVGTLVTADYTANVRDLQRRIWEALESSDSLELAAASLDDSEGDSDDPSLHDGTVDPQAITAAAVHAALEAADGSRDRAWRALGLRNRHQLLRIMRRLGISPTRRT